jgi:hypothetical protein
MKMNCRFPVGAMLALALLSLGAPTPALQAQTTATGRIGLSVPAGFSLVANVLNTGDNTVSEVLTNGAIDGMALYKLDPTNLTFIVNAFQGGAWSDPTQTLAPGEGAFLFSPRAATLTLVGEITEGSYTNTLPAGLSLVGSILPLGGQLDTDLSFPAAEGDIIYRFDNATGDYKVYTYDLGSWTAPPSLAIGESFFVWKTTATNWVQTISF